MGAVIENGQVPLRYTDSIEEYWGTRKGAGFSDLSHQGRLTIQGKDKVSFLNGLLTNDIAKLETGTGLHSALLNTKARVLVDLYLYALDDRLVADIGYSSAGSVKTLLDGFIITEDVKVEDSTERELLLTVQGPAAAKCLNEVLMVDVSSLESLQNRPVGPAIVVARDRTGLGGYDLVLPREEAEAVWQGLLLKCGGFGLVPVGAEALEILRLEKGTPRYGVDFDENTIVLEAGFKDAISFSKGCYMGQEVVARATHIGHVNKKLVQLQVEGTKTLKPRSLIKHDGNETGLVTSATFSPGLEKVVGLGYVQRLVAVEGMRLNVESNGVDLPAAVTKVV